MVRGGNNPLLMGELLLAEGRLGLGGHRSVLQEHLSQHGGLHNSLVSRGILGDHVLYVVNVVISRGNVLRELVIL